MNFWFLFVLGVVLFFTSSTKLNETPFILIDMLNMNQADYGIIGLILGSSVFIGSLINTRLLRHFSPYALNVLGCAIMLLSCALLVLVLPSFSALALEHARLVFLLLVGYKVTYSRLAI